MDGILINKRKHWFSNGTKSIKYFVYSKNISTCYKKKHVMCMQNIFVSADTSEKNQNEQT